MDKKSTISASDASNANVDLVDTNIKDATIKEELAKDNVVKDITKAMNDSIKKTDNEEAEDILKIMENHNEQEDKKNAQLLKEAAKIADDEVKKAENEKKTLQEISRQVSNNEETKQSNDEIEKKNKLAKEKDQQANEDADDILAKFEELKATGTIKAQMTPEDQEIVDEANANEILGKLAEINDENDAAKKKSDMVAVHDLEKIIANAGKDADIVGQINKLLKKVIPEDERQNQNTEETKQNQDTQAPVARTPVQGHNVAPNVPVHQRHYDQTVPQLNPVDQLGRLNEDLGGSFGLFAFVAFMIMIVYRMRAHNQKEPKREPKGGVADSLLNDGPPAQKINPEEGQTSSSPEKKMKKNKDDKDKKKKKTKDDKDKEPEDDEFDKV